MHDDARFPSGIRLRDEAPDSRRVKLGDLEVQSTSLRPVLVADIHHASDSHFYCGIEGDVHRGGVFVSTYRPVDIGSKVVVELTLPGASVPVRVRGRVRFLREHSHAEPRGVGIAIEPIAPEDRARVEAFCRLREPLYYDDVG